MDAKATPATSSLFRSDGESSTGDVTLRFEGRPVTAPQGVSIAAALLLDGVGPFRTTPVTSAPRAPFCMMGVCFDCLVEVDGVPNCQACLTPVRQGMEVRRQRGAAALPSTGEGDGNGR